MPSLRLIVSTFLLLSACGGDAPVPNKQAVVATERTPPKETPGDRALRVPSIDTLRMHISNLADDTMQGRRPGTEGGRTTERYLKAQMEHLGLLPAGDNGTFRQRVPIRGVTMDPKTARFSLTGSGGEAKRLEFGAQLVATSFQAAGQQDFDSKLVFMGYGVTAPEYEWDDYAGVDVTGKTVVVFVGDPPVTDGRFRGHAMTYYGRWSYKFERALAAGAVACLVIHEADPASYGWHVVEDSWSGERFGLRHSDEGLPPALGFQGWLNEDAAEGLAASSGTSLADWHTEAMTPGFVGRPLKLRVTASFQTTERDVEANNIIGKLPGRDTPDEAVVITAHWDHLGHSPAPFESNGIFNGAIDNASGLAGMLVTAASLLELQRKGRGPKRSVVFLATTAEEQGLLGSRYYADHAIVPLDNIVGVANLDSMNVDGRTNSVVIVGAGQSTLEDTLAEVVSSQGRHTLPDSRPESGGYYRSDQFSFARRGIPALYFRGSTDLEVGGIEAGTKLAKIRSERYHTVFDKYDPAWSLEGTLQDVETLVDLVLRVANADKRPTWKSSSEFANIR